MPFRHRLNIRDAGGTKREVILESDSPSREEAENVVFESYPESIIEGYGRWEVEPEAEEEEDANAEEE